MQGLLWRQVDEGNVSLSRNTVRQVAAEFMRVRHRNLTIWETLGRVSSMLTRRKIRFLVLKGIANEARWYEQVGDRPTSDLDIWVSPEDKWRFGEIVRGVSPGHPLGHSVQGLVDAGHLQSVDLVSESGILIDLHADPFNFGLRARTAPTMWATQEEVTSPLGGTVPVLSATSSLVHSLVHLNQDGLGSLVGFADVCRIIKDERIDPDAAISMLQEEGLLAHGMNTLNAVADVLNIRTGFDPSSYETRWWRAVWPRRSFFHRGKKSRRRVSAYAMRITARRRQGQALLWGAKSARRAIRLRPHRSPK